MEQRKGKEAIEGGRRTQNMESVSSDYSAYNSFLSHINQLSKVLYQPLAFPLATQRDWRTADCPSCDLSKYSWIKVPAHSLIPKYISGANKTWNKASHLTAAVNCIPLQSAEIDASVQSSMWQPTTFFRLPSSLSYLRRVWKPWIKAKEGKRRPDTTQMLRWGCKVRLVQSGAPGGQIWEPFQQKTLQNFVKKSTELQTRSFSP